MSTFLREYGVAATIDGVPLITRDAADFKANPTLAAGDVKISKDGGAFANLTTLPAATPASGSAVRISLSATEMQAARIVIQFVDLTNPKEWEDQTVIIETHSHASGQHQFGDALYNGDYWDAAELAVATTLTTYRLDHLMAAAVVGTDVVDNSVVAKLASKSATADWDSYDNTTDSLEAIRDRGDAAWIDAGGTSPFLLLDTTVATVNSQTDFDLAAGPALTASLDGMVVVFYDVSNGDAPSIRRVTDYTIAGNNITIENIFSVTGGAPDFTVVAGDKVRVFAVPIVSYNELNVLGLDVNLQSFETAIPASPNADSIHERLKALDDAYTAARAVKLDNLDATISSRSTLTAAQAADQVWDESRAAHLVAGSFGEGVIVNALSANADAQVVGDVGSALNTAIPGSPTANSINERVKAIDDKLPAGSLVGNDTATSTRLSYLDKLNITGNVASSGEVTAIQNNTRVRVIVPAVMERDDGGPINYRFWLYVYDTEGSMEAPDSIPTVTVFNQSGLSRSANLGAVQVAGTGSYYVDYTVADTHFIEQLLVEWTVRENTVDKFHGASTFVVDTTAVDFTASDRADLAAIKGKTDQLAFTGTDVRATLDGEQVNLTTLTQASINAIDIATANVNTRLTTARANNLDNLDATISSRSTITEAQVNAQVDLALSDINLDHLMAVAVAGGDVVDNSLMAKVLSKAATASFASFNNTTDSLEAIADLGVGGGGASADAIADAIAVELIADHEAVAGSLFEAIKIIRSEFTNLAIADKITGRTTIYDDDGVTPMRARELQKGATEAQVKYQPVGV